MVYHEGHWVKPIQFVIYWPATKVTPCACCFNARPEPLALGVIAWRLAHALTSKIVLLD